MSYFAPQAFFEPARTATIPNITSAEELMPANALSSATWSAMLALGALFSVPGVLWLIIQSRWKEAPATPLTPARDRLSGEEEGLERRVG